MDIMHIESSFKFHPVGFGLFTSGKIESFRFVYDCGSRSKTKVNNCIELEYPKEEKINLDLLSISHFHFDHISGLKKLLDSVVKIDTIILPYYTPTERLLYILSLNDNSGEFTPDGWEFDFLKDPTGYLISNFNEKIGKIILIKGGSNQFDSDTKLKDNLDKDIQEDEYKNLEINFEELEDSNDVQEIQEIEGIESSKVFVKKYGSVNLYSSNKTPIWQFVFYYPPFSQKAILYFNQILAKVGLKSINTKSDLKAIVDKVSFNKIATKTKMHGNDINNTSLILYHSPINKRNMSIYRLQVSMNESPNCYFRRYGPINGCPAKGFFYSGDIDLKTYSVDIDAYFNILLDNICVFQIPHHGSIGNWKPTISYRNKGALHVVSSKLSNNKLLHPNPKVLHSIVANNGLILWCNETNCIEFYGILLVH